MISSVSVSADGTRVCTGGNDKLAAVWSLAAVRARGGVVAVRSRDTGDAAAMRALGTARYGRALGIMLHEASVSCVRYQPGASDVLAAASDDGAVLVWRREAAYAVPTVRVFGLEGRYHERYVLVRAVRAHRSDVPDLAWSPDGTRLASCSVDNTLCVFRTDRATLVPGARAGDALLRRITDARGPVKGLAWDPLDRYLVAQTEDAARSVLVFDTRTFALVRTIADCCDPAEELFFRKPDWRPDAGAFVCTACRGHCAAEFDRSLRRRHAWAGFDRAVAIARYGRPHASRRARGAVVYPVALVTLNNLLLVKTTEDDILLCAKNIFAKAPTDIAWTPDGATLLLVSWDGALLGVEVDPAGVLGPPCSKDAFDRHLRALHGEVLTVRPPTSSLDIPESVSQFLFEQNRRAEDAAAKAQNAAAAAATRTPQKQVETIKNGRRRITPIAVTFDDATSAPQPSSLVSSPHSLTATPVVPVAGATASAVATSSASPPNTATATATTDAPPQQDVRESNLEKRLSEQMKIPTSTTATATTTSSNNTPETTPAAASEPGNTTPLPQQPITGSESVSGTQSKDKTPMEDEDQIVFPPSCDANPRPAPISAPKRTQSSSSLSDHSSKRSRLDAEGRHKDSHNRERRHEHGSSSSNSSNSSNSNNSTRSQTSGGSSGKNNFIASPTVAPLPKSTLVAPQASDFLHFDVPTAPGERPRHVSAKVVAGATVVVLKETGSSAALWSVTVPQAEASHLVANRAVCALLCTDASLHVLSTASGCYVLPRVWLGSPPVRAALAPGAPVLAVVTAGRELSVYDFAARRAIVSRVPISPALLADGAVQRSALLSVAPSGVARFATPTATVAYAPRLASWLAVARAVGPGLAPAAAPVLSAWECEQNVAMAEMMEAQVDYELAVLSYAQALVRDSDAPRLRQLLETLRARMAAPEAAPCSCSEAFFRRVLALVAANRSLQRLVDEYSEPQTPGSFLLQVAKESSSSSTPS